MDDFEEVAYIISVLSSKLAQHLFKDKVEPFFVLDDEDLAMELYYAIAEGEMSFHEVAHQYIQDKELRRSGGYRGILQRKDLKPEFSAAVFAATPPQVLKPILSSKGVHLILVEELIEPQLDETLRYKILSDLFSEWLKQQIEQFEVEIDLNSNALGSNPEPQVMVKAAVWPMKLEAAIEVTPTTQSRVKTPPSTFRFSQPLGKNERMHGWGGKREK